MLNYRCVYMDILRMDVYPIIPIVLKLPEDHGCVLICDLAKVLHDLTGVTNFMSEEQRVLWSHICPIVCGLLRSSLYFNSDDRSIACRVKEALRNENERRFHAVESANSSCTSTNCFYTENNAMLHNVYLSLVWTNFLFICQIGTMILKRRHLNVANWTFLCLIRRIKMT